MFGLVIMVMVYATGHLSGAHINPAVTIAFTRHAGTSPSATPLAYIPAQLAGATAGALALRLVWHGTPANLGATVPTVGTGSAFVYETILTAFLMFVIMAVATDTRAVGAAAAIAIGGTVGLDALVRRRRHRSLDEPGALFRACARHQRVARLLDLPRRAARRCADRRLPLPGRARPRRPESLRMSEGLATRPRNEVIAEAVTSWMRMLAALMLSLMLLSSALLLHGMTMDQPLETQPSSVAEHRPDHSRQQVVLRGR